MNTPTESGDHFARTGALRSILLCEQEPRVAELVALREPAGGQSDLPSPTIPCYAPSLERPRSQERARRLNVGRHHRLQRWFLRSRHSHEVHQFSILNRLAQSVNSPARNIRHVTVSSLHRDECANRGKFVNILKSWTPRMLLDRG